MFKSKTIRWATFCQKDLEVYWESVWIKITKKFVFNTSGVTLYGRAKKCVKVLSPPLTPSLGSSEYLPQVKVSNTNYPGRITIYPLSAMTLV